MEVQASVLESFQLLENVRMPIAKELYPKKSKQYILFKPNLSSHIDNESPQRY